MLAKDYRDAGFSVQCLLVPFTAFVEVGADFSVLPFTGFAGKAIVGLTWGIIQFHSIAHELTSVLAMRQMSDNASIISETSPQSS